MKPIYELPSLRLDIDERPEFFRAIVNPERAAAGETRHYFSHRDRVVDQGNSVGQPSYKRDRESVIGAPVLDLGRSGDEVGALLDLAQSEFGERYRNRIIDEGIEALGWYVSFHLRGAQYGIYIRLSGVAWLASELVKTKKGAATTDEALLAAWRCVLFHEWAHFLVDRMVLQMENAYGIPVWAANFDRRDPKLRDLEEQVANAYMLRCMLLSGNSLWRRAILGFVKRQPPGYRDALPIWRKATSFLDVVADFAFFARECIERKNNAAVEWSRLSGLDSWPDWRDVPIILVDDLTKARLLVAPSFITAVSRVV